MTTLYDSEYAILAMDAYQRRDEGEKIGDAEVLIAASTLEAGFYAVAYKTGSEIVISYRGTDEAVDWLSYPQGGGAPWTGQIALAMAFYRDVMSKSEGLPIVTTGHSLGGGLAGFVASVVGLEARLFDSMAFEAAVSNAYNMARFVSERPGQVNENSELYRVFRDIYDEVAPTPPDFSGKKSFEIFGQALGFNQSNVGVVPAFRLGSNDVGQGLDQLERHSMGLLAIRMFAEEVGRGVPESDNWKNISVNVFPNLFADEIANAAGFIDHDGMIGGIANSGLNLRGNISSDVSVLPNGDAAIGAFYSGMNVLADAFSLGITGVGAAVESWDKTAYHPLAQILTQYSAGLAKNAAFAPNHVYTNVLSIDDDDRVIVDLSEEAWRMDANLPETIVGRETLIDLVREDVAVNLEGILTLAFGRQATAVIDHIVFATGYDPYLHKFAPGDLGALKTLYVGTGGTDDIFGTDGDDLIYAGALNVTTESGGTITGGDGSDILIGSSAEDILLGGDGLDILIGGDGADTLDAGGGTSQDILLGGNGLNTFLNFGAGIAVGGLDEDVFHYDVLGASLVVGGGSNDVFNVNTAGVNQAYTIIWGGGGSDTLNVTTATELKMLVIESSDITEQLAAQLAVGLYGVFDELPYSVQGVNFASYDIIYLNPDDNDSLYVNGERYWGSTTSVLVGEYPSSDMSARVYENRGEDGHVYQTYIDESGPISRLASKDLTIDGAYRGIFGIAVNNGISFELYNGEGFDEGRLLRRDYFMPDGWGEDSHPDFNFSDYTVDKAADRFEQSMREQGFDTKYPGIIGLKSDYVEGEEGNDRLEGTSRNNYFYAAGGDDEVFGYEGDDEIEAGSGAGNDYYDGGAGTDTIFFPSTSLGVTVDLASGTAHGVEIDDDVLVNIENVVGGSGDDDISGDDGANLLLGAEGDDKLYGRGGDDVLIGGWGRDVLDGGEGQDTVSYRQSFLGLVVDLGDPTGNTGEAEGDSYVSIENIEGSNFSDILTGNEFANRVSGGNGSDIITGAEGDDELLGGGGADHYLWAVGDGNDVILDRGGISTDIDILHLQDVDPSSVRLMSKGSSIFLTIADVETIELKEQLLQNGNGVEAVVFGTGETWDREYLSNNAVPINSAPELLSALPNQAFAEDAQIDFQLPIGTFVDIDGDVLTLSASLSDGSPLPDWLEFDRTTGTFSGLPPQEFYGSLEISVSASDGDLEASGSFALNIGFVNDGPILASPLADQIFEGGQEVNFALPKDAFLDPDGQTPWVVATMVDGGDLPEWLTFNPFKLSFVGIPPQGFSGVLEIKVSASDGQYEVSDVLQLEITVSNNQEPVVTNPAQDQSSPEDFSFNFALPNDIFSDPDGDTLTLTAARADGSDLPGWLSFDAGTRAFSGTPPQDFNGSLEVKVTASDGALEVSDNFVLEITPVNDAPVAVNDGTFAAVAGAPLAISAQDLLANDTDVDNDMLSILSVSNGAHGQVSIADDGSVHYVADVGFEGSDNFTYRVTDGDLISEATVSLSVLNPDDPYEGWRQGTDGSDLLFGNLFRSNQIYGAGGNDLITGGLRADELDGGAGNDVIVGLSGDDRIAGGPGTDVLFGGSGRDTFIFREGSGTDIVMDFSTGSGWLGFISGGDKIEIDIDGLSSFEDLMGFGHQDGSDTIFDFGDGDLLILKNTQLAALDNDAFSIV